MEAEPSASALLSAWFAPHALLRAIVEAVIERRIGTVRLDDDERPRAARLSCGCYELLGGDPSSPGARRLVAEIGGGREIVHGNDTSWRALILSVLGGRVRERPMHSFDSVGIDPAMLSAALARQPARFGLVEIDARWASGLDDGLAPHALQSFGAIDAFVGGGFGFGLVRDDELVAAATSYARSAKHVEIAIATRTAWRGRGLAALAAAAFVQHAAAAGLLVHWNAANPISQHLAMRLGFRFTGVCEVLQTL